MSRYLIIFILLILLMSLSACSDKVKDGEKIVAKINDYYMSIDDFKQDLKVLTIYKPQGIQTIDDKKEILNDLIKKEVLLQEAQKLNLDKDKEFIKTIENYWKQTLLKLLIERKSREIQGKVQVYNNEIREYYNKLKKEEPDIEPLDEIKNKIEFILRRDKETAMMNQWLDELVDKADIEINEEVLKEIKFE